mgnify:CR=1 FL=1
MRGSETDSKTTHKKTLKRNMLKNWTWSRNYTECIICHTTKHKHCWRWRCVGCYEKDRAKRPVRRRKTNEYKLKYARTHKQSEQTRANWKLWCKSNWEVLNILAKGRRWQRNWIICTLYKNRPIPLDITSRDTEIQRKWNLVKSYLDNKKCWITP